METMKKWLIASLVIIICLSIALTACLFWVRSLSNRMTELEIQQRELFDDVAELYGELYGLQAELEEMGREADSLLEELEYAVIGAGTQPHTAAYQLTLIPKEVAADTTVELTVGDTTVPFTREGNAFTGTVDIPLFRENENYPVMTVTSAGITRTDELEEVELWLPYQNLLPTLSQTVSGFSSTTEAFTQVDLTYCFTYNTEHSETPVTFVKLTEVKTVDGKEISNRDVTDRLPDGSESDFYEYNTGCILEQEQTVVLTIRAEDSLGYIHELKTYVEPSAVTDVDSDGSPVISTSAESIYTPDGQLLCGE